LIKQQAFELKEMPFLNVAVNSGNLEVVKLLLANKKYVDVNRKCTVDGLSALQLSSISGNLEIFSELFRHELTNKLTIDR